MDILKIERTQSTPEVLFDPDEFLLFIEGTSRPEDAEVFYSPLYAWLEEFFVQHDKTPAILLDVEIKLTYFNSSSFLKIVDLFKIIKKIHSSGIKVIVGWYYSEDDELIYEVGQEISEISELPFNFIEE